MSFILGSLLLSRCLPANDLVWPVRYTVPSRPSSLADAGSGVSLPQSLVLKWRANGSDSEVLDRWRVRRGGGVG